MNSSAKKLGEFPDERPWSHDHLFVREYPVLEAQKDMIEYLSASRHKLAMELHELMTGELEARRQKLRRKIMKNARKRRAIAWREERRRSAQY